MPSYLSFFFTLHPFLLMLPHQILYAPRFESSLLFIKNSLNGRGGVIFQNYPMLCSHLEISGTVIHLAFASVIVIHLEVDLISLKFVLYSVGHFEFSMKPCDLLVLVSVLVASCYLDQFCKWNIQSNDPNHCL